jgi:pimeloyl-ACP methyl ester carboxylesterase
MAAEARPTLDEMSAQSPYATKLDRIPVREGSARILGSDSRYWEYGDPTSATTVVVVHGFRGDHHGLEPVVAQLPGLHIIAPDLPGFGASTPLTEAQHDIGGYARWLRELVAGLGVQGRLVLLGHSFGSIVASAALATDAATVRPDELILVNPIAAPALSGPRGVFTRLAVFYYWAASKLPERLGFALLRSRAIVRVMSVTMAKTRDKALRSWIHEEHDRYFSAFADRRVVLEAFRASVSHDVSEYARRIGEPTLLIAAEHDDITPVAAQRTLATLFPQAELVVIPAVGHLIHYETPAVAAEAITDFLARPTR